jgi:hypothetical protein
MDALIFFTAAMIRAFRSARSCGTWHMAMVGCIVYVPPLPPDLADLKAWIIEAVKNTDAPMLMHMRQELEYCIDVCRVTRGAHIEHL